MSDSDQDEVFLEGSSSDEEQHVHSQHDGKNHKAHKRHTNLYSLLGIRKTADEKQIRKAYHHQSTLYHTDKMNLAKAAPTAQSRKKKSTPSTGGVDDIDGDEEEDQSKNQKQAADPEVEATTAATTEDLEVLMRERFQKINEAYQILSDPRTRAAYDHKGIKKGVERLALVPEHFTSPESIARALDALEYELEAKRTAKLVGSHGKLTVCLNWLDLGWAFKPKKRKQHVAPEPTLHQDFSEADDPPTPLPPVAVPAEETSSGAENQAEAASEGHQAAPTGGQHEEEQAPATATQQEGTDDVVQPAPAPPPTPAPMQMQGEIKKAVVDGREMFIIIPGPEIQNMMGKQHALAAQQSGGGDGGAMNQPVAAPPQQQQQQQPKRGFLTRTWHSVAKYTTPYQIQLVHGMMLPVPKGFIRQATMSLRTTVTQAKNGAGSDVRVTLESVRSHCSTISLMAQASVGSIKWSLRQVRQLSLKWTVTNTLSLIEQGCLLSRYTVKLRRVLSRQTTMSLNWSLSYLPQGGYFTLTLLKALDLQGLCSKQLSWTMSPGGGMNVHFSRQNFVYFRKGKKNEKKVTVSQQVTMDPGGGNTSISYDAMVPVSKMRKIGLGVSTTFPLALSPIAPPIFLVMQQQWSITTQFHVILQQAEHRLAIPILISGNPKLYVGIQFCAAPFILYQLACKFGTPVLAVWEARRARERRRAKASELLEARDKALLEQLALKDSVQARRAAEGNKGLVIINAVYQLKTVVAATSTKTSTTTTTVEPVSTTLDVTVPLQSLVQHSELTLPEGGRAHLTGFYALDPDADPTDVELDVTYWFNGERHSVTVNDTEALQLPQAEHQILS